jgi:hypothetical protein
VVVTARSVLLYERLLAHDPTAPAPVRARCDRLVGEATEAVRILGAHLDGLTEPGRTLAAAAADVVRAYA